MHFFLSGFPNRPISLRNNKSNILDKKIEFCIVKYDMKTNQKNEKRNTSSMKILIWFSGSFTIQGQYIHKNIRISSARIMIVKKKSFCFYKFQFRERT